MTLISISGLAGAVAQVELAKQMRAKFSGTVYEIQGGAYDGKRGYEFSLRSRQGVPVQLTTLPGTIDQQVYAVLSTGGIHSNGQPSFAGRSERGEIMFEGTVETLNAVPKPRANNRPANIIVIVDDDVRRVAWDFGDKTSRALLRNAKVEPLNLGPSATHTLGYPEFIPLLYGEAATPILPEFSSEFSGFTVTPALPGELVLDPETGEISGIAPDENNFQDWYTVTAHGVSQEISIYTTVSLAEIDIDLDPNYRIVVDGFAANRFNSRAITFSVGIEGEGAFYEYYHPEYAPVTLNVNDEAVSSNLFSFTIKEISAPVSLDDGPNTIQFEYSDAVGRRLYANEIIWSGSNDFTINLRDAAGGFYTSESAEVTILAADNRDITATGTAELGQAHFSNIPDRTLMIQVVTESGLRGFGAAHGGDGSVDIVIRPDGPISNIDNNDLSNGLEGWIPSHPDAISLVPHDETRGLDVPKDDNLPDNQDEGALEPQLSPHALSRTPVRAQQACVNGSIHHA